MATYRRNTEDVDEVTFIADLISTHVAAEIPALSTSGKAEDMDRMHKLLDYRKKWNGMKADLTTEGQSKPKSPQAITTKPRTSRTGGSPAPQSSATNE